MDIKRDLLTPNNYSRPQEILKKVKAVVIHWVANPNTTADNNRDFFESRKSGKKGYGSAHFVVGQVGEIVQCLPVAGINGDKVTEMAYHVGSTTYTSEALRRLSSYPNNCSVGIECCHYDMDGHMKEATYDSIVNLSALLLKNFDLTVNDLWTHQLVVGWKDCHRLFYKHPDLWEQFKKDVAKKMGATETPTTAKPKYDLPTGTYGFGSRGDNVRKIQTALNKLGFNVGGVDGVYGAGTRSACYRYQSMFKALTNDGIYGNATRSQMLKDLNK
jgi:N-acetylmuramoyl-L-alanine amidase CwlA